MNFPSSSAGKEIALSADTFFWIVNEIGPTDTFHRAMFGLFGDTDVDIAASSAVGIERNVEADLLLCSRSNDTVVRLVVLPFDAEDTGALLSELLG